MVRTPGSKDKRRRKSRSDKGKRRKKYRGKPTKPKRKRFGRFVPYVPPAQKKSVIKIWFWEEAQMTPEGIRRFSRHIRRKMRRIVYKPRIRLDVPVSMLSTNREIENLTLEHLWPGTFLIMGFSKGKNKWGVKPVKLCKVNITDHVGGMRCRVVKNYRLFRYWFWRGQ